MRKLAFLVIGGAVWLMVGAMPAFADNGPHMSTAGVMTDRCAGCHRLHSAKEAYLLDEQEPALCYTCHGDAAGGSALAVTAGVGYANSAHGGSPGGLRGGGFQYALLGGQVVFRGNDASGTQNVSASVPVGPSEPTRSAHSVDESAQTSWGGGAFSATANYGTTGVPLTCTSCHDPHGGSNTAGATNAEKQTYRILKVDPAGLGSLTPACVLGNTTVGSTCTVNVTAGSPAVATGEIVTCTVAAGPVTTCVSTNALKGHTTTPPPNGPDLDTPQYTPCTVPTVSTASVCRPGTQMVVTDVATKSYNTTDYWQDLADPAISRVGATGRASAPYATFLVNTSNWCSACHTRYRATSGKTYRYNTGDGAFAYRHRSDSPSGFQQAGDSAGSPNGTYKASPSCLQCHVSHGSNSQTGTESGALQNPGGGTAGLGMGGVDQSLDNRLLRLDQRGVCENCHLK